MSADTDVLVFDMSSQSEGSPNIFVRKDFLSLMGGNINSPKHKHIKIWENFMCLCFYGRTT